MNDFCFIADDIYVNQRIDKFLSAMICDRTRSFLQNLIEKENVLVNGKTVTKNYKLRENDKIEVHIPPAQPLQVEAENIELDIVYEDNDLLVVNKPKGMVVHPAPGNYTGTLVNALLYHCKDNLSGINGVLRPGIVHRIDKDTSGLLIVAKSEAAHIGLAQQIKSHSFEREYICVVIGRMKESVGTIDYPIGRNPNNRLKMAVVSKNSKNAVTHYEVLQEYRGYSLLKVKLETGRTHQIRVHMSYIGHPVAGDEVYGGKQKINFFQGQCLHAAKIGFIHPVTQQQLTFETPMPEYFEKFISFLNKTAEL